MTEYFTSLFSSNSPSHGAREDVLVAVNPSITKEMNDNLTRRFTKDETL